MLACKDSDINVVKLLLDRNANIEAKDNKGWTPIMFACRYCNVDVINLLLESWS